MKESSSTKQQIIAKWQDEHPYGTKTECGRDTRLARTTVDKYWDDSKGRYGSSAQRVKEWQNSHPHGRKTDCARDTGLYRSTIDKYWKN